MSQLLKRLERHKEIGVVNQAAKQSAEFQPQPAYSYPLVQAKWLPNEVQRQMAGSQIEVVDAPIGAYQPPVGQTQPTVQRRVSAETQPTTIEPTAAQPKVIQSSTPPATPNIFRRAVDRVRQLFTPEPTRPVEQTKPAQQAAPIVEDGAPSTPVAAPSVQRVARPAEPIAPVIQRQPEQIQPVERAGQQAPLPQITETAGGIRPKQLPQAAPIQRQVTQPPVQNISPLPDQAPVEHPAPIQRESADTPPTVEITPQQRDNYRLQRIADLHRAKQTGQAPPPARPRPQPQAPDVQQTSAPAQPTAQPVNQPLTEQTAIQPDADVQQSEEETQADADWGRLSLISQLHKRKAAGLPIAPVQRDPEDDLIEAMNVQPSTSSGNPIETPPPPPQPSPPVDSAEPSSSSTTSTDGIGGTPDSTSSTTSSDLIGNNPSQQQSSSGTTSTDGIGGGQPDNASGTTLGGDPTSQPAPMTSGNTTIQGNVVGPVSAGGTVTVGGNVTGEVQAGGDVQSGANISATTVTAGGSVNSGISTQASIIASPNVSSGNQIMATSVNATSVESANTIDAGMSQVAGNLEAGVNVTTGGGTNIAGGVSSGANLTSMGNTIVAGDVTVGAGATTTGATTITGGVTTGGALTSTGQIQAMGNVSAVGGANLIGTSMVGGNVESSGNVTMPAANVGGNVSVGGNANASGASVAGNVTVGGSATGLTPTGGGSSSTGGVQRKIDPTAPPTSGPNDTVIMRSPAVSPPVTKQPPAQARSPLQDAWPVQRKPQPPQEPTVHQPAPNLTPLRETNQTDVQLKSILDNVSTGQNSSTPVQIITPRRPRPVMRKKGVDGATPAKNNGSQSVQRQLEAPAVDKPKPKSANSPALQRQIDAMIQRSQAKNGKNPSSPASPPAEQQAIQNESVVQRQSDPAPVIQRQPAVAANSPSTPQQPQMVETGIGALPADLWNLVGETPPQPASGQTQNIVQRTPENGVQRHPEISLATDQQPVQRELAARPAAEESAETSEAQPAPEIDTDELAKQVYAQLKRQLSVDWERQQRR